MRFRNLEGLTSLPVDAVKHRFRNEHVLTVLPVYGSMAGLDSLLVATPDQLSIITADPRHRDRWITSLAPWDVVRLGEPEADDELHRLAIHVGKLVFQAELRGPKGEQALRDFVVAARAQHEVMAVAT